MWPVAETGADGWLEGPAMVNQGGFSTMPRWNNVQIVWTPDANTGGESGTLAMSVQYTDPLHPTRVVSGRTTHHLRNASNIGGANYDWVFGASRFPKEDGCAARCTICRSPRLPFPVLCMGSCRLSHTHTSSLPHTHCHARRLPPKKKKKTPMMNGCNRITGTGRACMCWHRVHCLDG